MCHNQRKSVESMSTGAFEKLEGAKAKKFVERLNKSWPGSPFDSERTVVHVRTLSFANDWVLAEAGDAISIPEKRAFALDNGKDCVPIEFSAGFIPGFAGKNGVHLDRDTAPDYLRFWFEYARAGADRFLLVEAVDDMPWREEATPQARKSLAKSITPLTLVAADAAGFGFKACVLFRDTLFDCAIDVSVNGQVDITSRQLVAEGLTVTDALTGF
jgi:hypothetical protein